MPSLVPLTVPRGNDVNVALSVVEADGITPQSLAAYTPVMVIKASAYAPDASGTTLAAGTGLTVVSPGDGTLTALLSKAVLAEPGPLWYRLDLTDPMGNVSTAIEGPITVTPG